MSKGNYKALTRNTQQLFLFLKTLDNSHIIERILPLVLCGVLVLDISVLSVPFSSFTDFFISLLGFKGLLFTAHEMSILPMEEQVINGLL